MDGPGRWSPGGVSTQQNPGHKTAQGGPVMDTLGGQEGREGELGLGEGRHSSLQHGFSRPVNSLTA